jgi:hypothetical protein
MGVAGSPGTSNGGGFFVTGGAVTLNNSTVALNTQTGNGSGGGVVVQSPGKVTAASTLFAGNGSVDFSGNVTATDSLFQTAPVNDTIPTTGNLTGDNPFVDAKGLPTNGVLQNNGGPTETIALLSGSPAIGAGENPDNLFADQRGYGPRAGAKGTDIGAYQTGAQADTVAPTATLTANPVSSTNASSENPYTFTITYTDNVAVAVSTLSNAVVQVLPPGAAAPITATVVSTVASGTSDTIGNASSIVVTYQITPPGGSWTSTDNGTYTVSLGGGSVTDLAGNLGPSGTLGTFSVNVASVLTATISGPTDGYSGVAGQTRTYTVTATDPSSTQQALGFTYKITWGDTTSTTTSAGASSPDTLTHIYNKPGTYTITVTATDQAGTTSAQVTSTAKILSSELQGGTLAIGGTTGNDTFIISAGTTAGSLTATVNGKSIGTFSVTNAQVYGAGGTDAVTINGVTNSADTFTLSGSTATFTAASLSPNTFSVGLNNIYRITFQGGNSGNTFTNTAPTVRSTLNGGSGTNTYNIAGTQMGSTTTIHGSGTSNTLNAPTLAAGAANTWQITGVNAGSLNGAGCSFTGVQNLVGGANADNFKVGTLGSLSGSIAGGAGTNTLTGPNLTDTFDITGSNAGSLSDSAGTIQFTSIQGLTGGTVTNYFVFSAGASLSSKIVGHGVSRLDYSAYGSAVYVNLLQAAATGTGGISGLTQVYGSGRGDVLVGNNTSTLLKETAGDNLIIADTGSGVTLDSGSGADLVIAGSTTYDRNKAALQAIETYWAANVGSSFASTVAGLTAGITGGYKLTKSTVTHQGTGDTINLGSASDWVFWRMVGTNVDTLSGTPEQSTFI